MKKAFIMIAVAFTFCGLFAACGDEEETSKDGITVTFGGEVSWKASTIQGDISVLGDLHVMKFAAYKDIDDDGAPRIMGYLFPAVGTFTYDANRYYMFYFENKNDYVNYNGRKPRWQPFEFREEVTAIDLTERTVSGQCIGEMYDLGVYIASYDRVYKDITITMENAHWEEASFSF